ncbi:LysE family translocator [Dinghuibacter silviterrae]|uniref:LysE type translocator n=1 Tax=Dinghuibacter silviterrae TaxID=1539049 RepID=A0A4R8DUZ6_9BACT|nr:LysE family transporter [Dinghuibacter silviterrae]TDX02230.1 LysE type translocator [Dinghuibacter silviterrae]
MMLNLLYVFGVGLLISFLGTLPLGTLNVAAMQIANKENIKAGIHFSLGVALVEIIYLRISLKGMGWVIEHHQLFYWLGWVTVAMLLALAFFTFRAATHPHKKKNILLDNSMGRFWLGATMSALNPVQIPFWFGWSTYLLTNRILLPRTIEFNFFTAGGGIGTLMGLAVFIWGGNYIIQKLDANQKKLDIFIGCIFLLTAFIQAYKVLTQH